MALLGQTRVVPAKIFIVFALVIVLVGLDLYDEIPRPSIHNNGQIYRGTYHCTKTTANQVALSPDTYGMELKT